MKRSVGFGCRVWLALSGAAVLPGCPSESMPDRVRTTELAVAVPMALPGPAVERPSAQGLSSEGLVPGQRITLRGDANGVPLHADRGTQKVIGRAPSGTRATLLQLDPGSNWLQIEEPSKRRSWIVRRYVAGAANVTRGARATKVAPPEISDSPWSSKQACLKWAKEPRIGRTTARIGTFNVEWFPDGESGDRSTDVEWLACVIASLDVDALAVQEFKTTPHASAKLRELFTHLDRFTTGAWRASFAECPGNSGARQHVGVLSDSRRVTVSGATTRAELNPHGSACGGMLRPGREVTLTWPSGRALRFVSVHFKAKDDARAYALRTPSFEALASAFEWREQDIVVAGDFNTAGCADCATPRASVVERQGRAQKLKTAGASLVPESVGCSSYHNGHPGLLDGFVVSEGLRGATTQLAGLCAEQACEPTRQVERSSANHELSDHCPLVLQLPF